MDARDPGAGAPEDPAGAPPPPQAPAPGAPPGEAVVVGGGGGGRAASAPTPTATSTATREAREAREVTAATPGPPGLPGPLPGGLPGQVEGEAAAGSDSDSDSAASGEWDVEGQQPWAVATGELCGAAPARPLVPLDAGEAGGASTSGSPSGSLGGSAASSAASLADASASWLVRSAQSFPYLRGLGAVLSRQGSAQSLASSAGPCCRICREGAEAGTLFTMGCLCKGEMGLVHQECFTRWMIERKEDHRNCEVCEREPEALYTKYPQIPAEIERARRERKAAEEQQDVSMLRAFIARRNKITSMTTLGVLVGVAICAVTIWRLVSHSPSQKMDQIDVVILICVGVIVGILQIHCCCNFVSIWCFVDMRSELQAQGAADGPAAAPGPAAPIFRPEAQIARRLAV